MRKVRLPESSENVILGVYHVDRSKTDKWQEIVEEFGEPFLENVDKVTKVRMSFCDDEALAEVHGYGVCKKPDQFNRKEGRRRAAMSLLRRVRYFSKEDRKAIFQNICPEYFKS